MQKTYLYLMVCVIGAMSLASCSEDSISPDAGGDGDGDSTTEVPPRSDKTSTSVLLPT